MRAHVLLCVSLLVSRLSPVLDTVGHDATFTSSGGLDDFASSTTILIAALASFVPLFENTGSSILDSSRHLLLNLLLLLALALVLLFASRDVALLLRLVGAPTPSACIRLAASTARNPTEFLIALDEVVEGDIVHGVIHLD